MTDDIPTIRRILKENHTIAMVGLSADWFRPSYFAAKYLQDHGYRVIPVNPRHQEILGEKCYARVQDIPDPIDVETTRRLEAKLDSYSAWYIVGSSLAFEAVILAAACVIFIRRDF